MPITRFILPLDTRAVGYHLATIMRFLSVVFAVPLLFALLTGEWLYAGIFTCLAAGSLGVGTFARRSEAPELEENDTLLFLIERERVRGPLERALQRQA